MDKLGVGYGCVSKRSVVQIGGTVIYASTDGLAAMGTNSSQILTADVISPDQWRETYTPTSISGYFWEGKYVGFYTTGSTQAGFYFDLKTGDFVPLDFYATAGYFDHVSGALHLVIDGNIVAFARGATFRTISLTSKRYRFPFGTVRLVKIIALTYPVTVTMKFYHSDGTASTITATATTSEPVRPSADVGLVDQCEVTVTDGVTAIFLASTYEELPL